MISSAVQPSPRIRMAIGAAHFPCTGRVSNLFQGAVFMKSSYNGNVVPSQGKPIGYSGGELQVPDTPIILFIEGDGTGRDICKASRRVFDAAVDHAYGGKRRVAWFDVFAGEK